jgi:hypothetical protein
MGAMTGADVNHREWKARSGERHEQQDPTEEHWLFTKIIQFSSHF